MLCVLVIALVIVALLILGVTIMAKLDDVLKQLSDLSGTVDKIGAETTKSLQMITDLQAQIANSTDVPDAVKAAVDKLAGQLKTVDDMVPDAPTP